MEHNVDMNTKANKPASNPPLFSHLYEYFLVSLSFHKVSVYYTTVLSLSLRDLFIVLGKIVFTINPFLKYVCMCLNVFLGVLNLFLK